MDHGDKCVAFGPVVSVVPDKLDSFDFSESTKFFSDGSFVGSERHAEDADDFGGGFVFGVFLSISPRRPTRPPRRPLSPLRSP